MAEWLELTNLRRKVELGDENNIADGQTPTSDSEKLGQEKTKVGVDNLAFDLLETKTDKFNKFLEVAQELMAVLLEVARGSYKASEFWSKFVLQLDGKEVSGYPIKEFKKVIDEAEQKCQYTFTLSRMPKMILEIIADMGQSVETINGITEECRILLEKPKVHIRLAVDSIYSTMKQRTGLNSVVPRNTDYSLLDEIQLKDSPEAETEPINANNDAEVEPRESGSFQRVCRRVGLLLCHRRSGDEPSVVDGSTPDIRATNESLEPEINGGHSHGATLSTVCRRAGQILLCRRRSSLDESRVQAEPTPRIPATNVNSEAGSSGEHSHGATRSTSVEPLADACSSSQKKAKPKIDWFRYRHASGHLYQRKYNFKIANDANPNPDVLKNFASSLQPMLHCMEGKMKTLREMLNPEEENSASLPPEKKFWRLVKEFVRACQSFVGDPAYAQLSSMEKEELREVLYDLELELMLMYEYFHHLQNILSEELESMRQLFHRCEFLFWCAPMFKDLRRGGRCDRTKRNLGQENVDGPQYTLAATTDSLDGDEDDRSFEEISENENMPEQIVNFTKVWKDE